MSDKFIVKDENNNDATIEIIFSFSIEKYNKKYIVYTIDDDGKSELVDVFISELDENNKIRPIPEKQKEIVLKIYEEAKKMI